MTTEQLTTFRTMTKGERARHYTPMLLRGEIDQKTYDYVCALPAKEGPPLENSLHENSYQGGQDSIRTSGELPQALSPTWTVRTMGTQKGRIFNVLSDGLWHSTIELMEKAYTIEDQKAGICRIAARVHDLRKEGNHIESRELTSGVWEYRLCQIKSV